MPLQRRRTRSNNRRARAITISDLWHSEKLRKALKYYALLTRSKNAREKSKNPYLIFLNSSNYRLRVMHGNKKYNASTGIRAINVTVKKKITLVPGSIIIFDLGLTSAYGLAILFSKNQGILRTIGFLRWVYRTLHFFFFNLKPTIQYWF